MKDYLFYLRATPEAEGDFSRWLLEDFGPRIAASPDCAGLHVNVAVPAPGSQPLYSNEAREGDAFDAALDLRCPDAAAFDRLSKVMLPLLAEKTRTNYGYDVTLLVEKDDPEGRLAGNPAPGYKLMRGFYAFEDLPPQAVRRSWDNHVNLAMKIHGFDRYVRYWVNDTVTEGTPRITGATNLQFHSAEAVVNNYFTVPDGMDQIKQDIAHFIRLGLSRIFARDYILK